MLQEHVDMVAGDFNGAAWRRPSGSDRRPISIIEEAFANTNLPIPPGPTLWGPGNVPGEWADVCGSLKPPCSESEWQVRMRGAFIIPYGTVDRRKQDQSCHHEVWMHLSHANSRARRYRQAERLQLKERTSPHDHSRERGKVHREQSDHSHDEEVIRMTHAPIGTE